LTPAEKSHLEGLVKATAPEDGVSKLAKIFLLCAEVLENREVARRLGTSAHTVGRWRSQDDGLQSCRRSAPHRQGLGCVRAVLEAAGPRAGREHRREVAGRCRPRSAAALASQSKEGHTRDSWFRRHSLGPSVRAGRGHGEHGDRRQVHTRASRRILRLCRCVATSMPGRGALV
jgi:hypothetical protein